MSTSCYHSNIQPARGTQGFILNNMKEIKYKCTKNHTLKYSVGSLLKRFVTTLLRAANKMGNMGSQRPRPRDAMLFAWIYLRFLLINMNDCTKNTTIAYNKIQEHTLSKLFTKISIFPRLVSTIWTKHVTLFLLDFLSWKWREDGSLAAPQHEVFVDRWPNR